MKRLKLKLAQKNIYSSSPQHWLMNFKEYILYHLNKYAQTEKTYNKSDILFKFVKGKYLIFQYFTYRIDNSERAMFSFSFKLTED